MNKSDRGEKKREKKELEEKEEEQERKKTEWKEGRTGLKVIEGRKNDLASFLLESLIIVDLPWSCQLKRCPKSADQCSVFDTVSVQRSEIGSLFQGR